MKATQSVTNSINHHSSPASTKRFAAIKIANGWTAISALGLLSIILPVSQAAAAETATAQSNRAGSDATPIVFQAAGPTGASIQSMINAFRLILGVTNNGNNPGPLVDGRREINWDGGNPAIIATTDPVTPFNVFLNTRGAQFTTPGVGLSQAAPDGLAALFNNATYPFTFTTFSPSRLFTPVGSNITEGLFFIPGTNGTAPGAVRGFGAVFTDVDQQDNIGGGKRGRHKGATTSKAGTLIECFDVEGDLIFSGQVPASPGDQSLSFFGVIFEDASIARVRITTGNAAPGANDDERNDIVMMDDFIYAEPQPVL